MRILFAIFVLISVSGAARAIPVTDVASVSAADKAEIDAAEKLFFDKMVLNGVEKTISSTFKELGDSSEITPEMVQTFKEIDDRCGKIGLIDRTKVEGFGSRIVRNTYVIMHGDCPIKWEITFLKKGYSWKFNRFNFLTYDGNSW